MKEERWTQNLHNRPLAEMKPGETLFAQRIISGMTRHFFGALVRIDKGSVEILGRWIDENGRSRNEAETTERFRVDRCFLYGTREGGKYPRCNWFSNGKHQPAQ